MNPVEAGIAALVVAGAILATAARDPRAAVLGVLVVLLLSPLVATPWPSPLAMLARVAAALLASRLLIAAVRGDLLVEGSRIGWPGSVLAAIAAAVGGVASHGLGAPALGPATASAASFALVAVALPPLLISRDVVRIGSAAILLVQAAVLLRQGLAVAPSDGEQLVTAALVVVAAGAAAVIAAAGRSAGSLLITDDDDASRTLRASARPRRGLTPRTGIRPYQGPPTAGDP